jgi:hypothetical protein
VGEDRERKNAAGRRSRDYGADAVVSARTARAESSVQSRGRELCIDG